MAADEASVRHFRDPRAFDAALAALDDATAVAVGGDYQTEDEAVRNVAVTDDGGVTWLIVCEEAQFDPRIGAKLVSFKT